MEGIVEIAGVPVIIALVYGVIELYKTVAKEEKYLKWIPIIAASLGVVLGVISFYLVPNIVPAQNVFVAILVGLASGLAATGTHQIFKQIIGIKNVDSGSSAEEKTDSEDKK